MWSNFRFSVVCINPLHIELVQAKRSCIEDKNRTIIFLPQIPLFLEEQQHSKDDILNPRAWPFSLPIGKHTTSLRHIDQCTLSRHTCTSKPISILIDFLL